ncbi:hypothetical protein OVY29_04890 [Sphingopyxis sp. SE2]|uniref:DUF6680 family protein n=1 Tax=Sphingopyxis sp. SE2 TaxID=1586240 RepID=UPI0028C1219E|nr:DUF6680 family protein [Sphingopyxis sp. SE2]MDT7527994.1 hypothetical protein [Sphingopyxis sp. SE2]
MKILFGATEPSIFGIDVSIWLNAAGILAGLAIAGLLTPWLASRSTRRDQQERTLRLLLNTWQTPANPDYQHAIAVIPIDFRKCRAVLDAHEALMVAVNEAPAQTEEEALTKNETMQNLQHQLMEAMATKLGLEVTAEKLRARAYLSKGFVDREMMFISAMQAWTRIADALERSNEMFAPTTPDQPEPEEK